MKKILVGCLIVTLLFLLTASVNFFLRSSLTGVYRLVMSGLLLIDSLIYVLLIVLRNSRIKWVKSLWIGVITGNMLLTLFDEFGIADFLFVAINLVVLVLYLLQHHKEGEQAHLKI